MHPALGSETGALSRKDYFLSFLDSISSRLGVGSAAGHRLQPVRGVARAEKAGQFIWAPVWPKLHEWVKAHPSSTVDWTAAEKHLRPQFPDIPVGAFKSGGSGRTRYSKWKKRLQGIT
eukprot:XP_001702007.1 predicted protein [Chlamydomonas reinhardtii]